MATTVTVAICTWNRAAILDQTLESFQRLRIPEGMTWELLVVNNNCSDDTDAVLAKHQALGKLPLRRLFEGKAGQSYARNLALAEARGEYILWTDDDVLVDPEWLAATMSAFRDYKADVVFGRIEPWWEGQPPAWFSTQFNGLFALLDISPEPLVLDKPTHTGYGVNHAFRVEALRKLGGYRVDMGLRHNKGAGGEDIDIFLRAFDTGLRVVYTPHALIHHYIPEWRCTKEFYRTRAWRGSEDHLLMLRGEAHGVPTLMGMPRHIFRTYLGYLTNYVKGLALRDRSRAFFYELKVIRLAGLVWFAFRGVGRERRRAATA